ncbi:MAG: YXWGXW repeat-containing protein [Candidatus Acidiferrales bacterium]
MRIRMIRVLLLAVAALFLSTASFAQVGVSITIAPPELPVYQQSICPGDGYIWTPGYWAYADDDYYWVPGAWVMAPEAGLLWTPGYWGWGGDGFVFSQGYWGEQVGFYGGINYGYGYFGQGYEGGRWNNGQFYYNTTENNLSGVNIHNVYSATVDDRTAGNRVSYNGGNGGIDVRATSQQDAIARERQVPPVPLQVQRAQDARTDPQQRASVNHGAPAVTATPTSGAFEDRGNAAATRSDSNASRYSTAVHPNDLPPIEHPASPNSGNAKLDRKYQKQQDKLIAQQNQDRQKLQQSQDRDHQNLARQNASEATKAQVEQQHQLQTQQMVQRHAQQQQQLQQRQPPEPPKATESRPPKG